ncbi:MAG: hypothetical protein K0R54_643 [Clostridiaceae bacterium]|jgi:hypothetical protein|nr:hypothetical protein [Clostridiaceae bacterium]
MINIGNVVKINVGFMDSYWECSGLFSAEKNIIMNNPENLYQVIGHEQNVEYPRNILLINGNESYFSNAELIQ